MFIETEKELKIQYPKMTDRMNQCLECNEYIDIAVCIGEASSKETIQEDTMTTIVCKNCLKKALQLIEDEKRR